MDPAGSAGPAPRWTGIAAQARPSGADSVSVRAVPARRVVRPGDQLPVAVVFDHADGFHSWPHRPVVPPEYEGVVPIPTEVRVRVLPEGFRAGKIQWPRPERVEVRYTGEPVDLLSYVGRAVAYVPLTLSAEVPPGDYRIQLEARVQSCDERICYPPKTVPLSVELTVAPAGTPVDTEVTEPGLFDRFGLEAYRGDGDGAAPVRAPLYLNVFGRDLSFDPAGAAGLALVLLLAALGGFLLNLTPCVLPLVPIKVMGLRNAAGSPGRLLALGSSMGAGVVAFWLVLGGAVAFVSGFDAISSLFQTGWFAPAVGTVVAVAGLAMLGLFRVPLPGSVLRFDPDHESVPGSFGFGIMTAVLSTPCTAPFMAGAAAWAALQPSAMALGTFAAIGVGMAAPYVALSARPGLVARIPRSGPASVLVKEVMGLLLLAVAAFFLGSGLAPQLSAPGAPPGRLYWWAVVFFVVAAFAWLAYRTWRITGSAAKRTVTTVAALLVAAAAVPSAARLASHGPIDWVAYTPERLEEARRARRVVVMDFTAEWCLNCKALESGVLHRQSVVDLLESEDVVPVKVDLTAENPVGQAKLRELGWVGIPLLAVFGPGVGYETPLLFDSYTAAMVRDAVERARGPGAGDEVPAGSRGRPPVGAFPTPGGGEPPTDPRGPGR